MKNRDTRRPPGQGDVDNSPQARPGSELPIIQQWYDLIAWLLPQIHRFPRVHRFGLGARIEDHMFEFLEELLAAKYADPRQRQSILRQASMRLVKLRYLLRLAVELRFLPLRKQEYLARNVDEVGRQLGGWLKTQKPR